jgi:transposase-like protein
MEDYPQNQLEFAERFFTEEACRAYLFSMRWPNGFQCPRCSSSDAWPTKRFVYRCSECDYQASVTSGTIFHGTRKPLRLWFLAMWNVTSQKYGANALGLQRVLGLGSYHTAWEWLHKLRRAMVRPGREKLSGAVEVDETYVGGRKSGKRGRGAEGKTLVMIAVEDKGKLGFGRIRLGRVEDASSDSLIQFIKDNVESGSRVKTDGWQGYSSLVKNGYKHEVQEEAGNTGEEILPLVHRIASLMKRWLMGTYQGAVREQHLDYYLDEYTFRFNRRTSGSRGKLFYRLVQQAMMVAPVPASSIIGGIGLPDENQEVVPPSLSEDGD